jgi:mono/diheme cytochrome c family protein
VRGAASRPAPGGGGAPDRRARVATLMKTIVGLGLAAYLCTTGGGNAAAAEDQFFREQVAPILERRCVQCHGDVAPKGNLSLTTARGVLKGGDGGPAVVPRKPQESLLLDMISGDQPEMPRKSGPLSNKEVAIIRAWVEKGASWPAGLVLADRRLEGRKWWALEPLKRPEVPAVVDSDWVKTPIDAFILATLQQRGLKPSSEADRPTLIRRLCFDLIGLPPEPAEIDRFVADASPNAYLALVDRLLASPHYGERWGRHWLDVVHYGDTHGYDKDKRRDNAWPFRDYVIGAFNADLPYGRFIREQVAGDALAPGDPTGAIATGFIAAGPWDFVGHVELREETLDKLKTRLLDRDDMVSTTMSTFVSLTVHCARCHDHKFDPITQTDYYRLQAVFSGVDRGDRTYQSRGLTTQRLLLEKRREAVNERYEAVTRKIEALTSPAVAAIDIEIKALCRHLGKLPRTSSQSASPSNGYHSAIHAQPGATAWVQVDLGAAVPIDEIRLIPARPTDFADTPGFGFPPQFHVELADEPAFARPERVVSEVRPDHQNAPDEPYVIRPKRGSARFVRVTATRLWKRLDDYVFALGEVEVISSGVNRARGAKVTALDSIEAGRWGRAKVVDGFDSRQLRPDASDSVAVARHSALFELRQAERERNRQVEPLIGPTLRREREATSAELVNLDAKIQSLAGGPRVYSIQSHAPRLIQVLRRGDVEQPGEPVGPGVPTCVASLPAAFNLPHPDDEGSRRAALADWLASTDNGLTWRSIANRVWHYHFGRGIVDTPNDFGRNGSLPTHPELLDWLAAELRDRGQWLKSLHRLIVSSSVYRQTSLGNPAFDAIDFDNRYLWRQNRRRLDAEAVRDGILAVSGTLERRMGGPGFELFSFKDDHSPIYDHTDPAKADNPSVRRRSIYRFIVRSVPNPFMEALDCADPNLNTPVRSQTLTALQALALWNDLFMVRQSQEFARRLEAQPGSLDTRIDGAIHLALGRDSRPEERDLLAKYALDHGLAHACRLLLNTNEFMFVD